MTGEGPHRAATIAPMSTGNGLEPWPVEGMTEAEAQNRWPDLPRNEQIKRAKLSVQAKERHKQIANPETGQRVFGGPQPGSGRPPKKRVGKEIADLASGSRQKEVVEAMFSGLHPRNSPATRVATAEKITKLEREERQLEMEESRFENEPKKALLAMLPEMLAMLTESGELPDPRQLPARKPYDVEGTTTEEAKAS